MCTELSDTNVKQKKKRKLVWVMYNFAKKMEALSPPPHPPFGSDDENFKNTNQI